MQYLAKIKIIKIFKKVSKCLNMLVVVSVVAMSLLRVSVVVMPVVVVSLVGMPVMKVFAVVMSAEENSEMTMSEVLMCAVAVSVVEVLCWKCQWW